MLDDLNEGSEEEDPVEEEEEEDPVEEEEEKEEEEEEEDILLLETPCPLVRPSVTFFTPSNANAHQSYM